MATTLCTFGEEFGEIDRCWGEEVGVCEADRSS